MKDRFSSDSQGYAAFRPGYPQALLEFMLAQTPRHGHAWDCGTGNGQLAILLAAHFEQVEATDISAHQLAQAPALAHIHYSQQAAEKTDFTGGTFDLVTIAQAIHWFDFERFYLEVRRVAAPDARIAVMGYPLFSMGAQLDPVIQHLYAGILQTYWDKERHYLDEAYRTIPFPFPEIACPAFESVYDWNFEQLMGYLNTWSAVKNYIQQNGRSPLAEIAADLKSAWSDAVTQRARFQMILRMGKLG